MSFLENRRLYLSGPLELCDDLNWREKPSEILKNEFKVDLFDPFQDPKQQRVEELNAARKARDFETVAAIAHDFVKKDLTMVDRSDLVVAYLPYKVPTTGTHEEIFRANLSKKPVCLVADGDLFHLPTWYFGYVKKEFMFDDWEQLFKYFRLVNQGLATSHRWDFIYNKL